MIAQNTVKMYGKWFKAGEEILGAENSAPIFSQSIESQKVQSEYTKTDINRMPLAELKDVANSNGIVGADEMTGAELKKALIEHFEL